MRRVGKADFTAKRAGRAFSVIVCETRRCVLVYGNAVPPREHMAALVTFGAALRFWARSRRLRAVEKDGNCHLQNGSILMDWRLIVMLACAMLRECDAVGLGCWFWLRRGGARRGRRILRLTLPKGRRRRLLPRCATDRRELQRPLVLIGGFADPAVAANNEQWFFSGVSRHAVLIPVSIGFCNSFAECREKVIAAVDAACPSNDRVWTSEVDVVGVSLGGLVARYAAAPSPDPAHPRRLRIFRLFSISSPQSGAKLAKTAGFTEFHREIQPGSKFLSALAASDATANYRIYPYTLLNDDIVGETNAAPPGMTPYWLASDSVFLSHSNAMADDRILADIARRLRGERPFTTYPPAPLPKKS